MRPPTYTGRHTINCPCPGCGYSTQQSAQSNVSQEDADNKAESAATTAFEAHDCPCR